MRNGYYTAGSAGLQWQQESPLTEDGFRDLLDLPAPEDRGRPLEACISDLVAQFGASAVWEAFMELREESGGGS